ncbi:hypothetical protein DFH11DRAFT_1600192 [Phellopilus nigrolimitatus]|nr:hypothetical protein DFH11DRAFT_1600192 [Phellopilus nigrolimitatus]
MRIDARFALVVLVGLSQTKQPTDESQLASWLLVFVQSHTAVWEYPHYEHNGSAAMNCHVYKSILRALHSSMDLNAGNVGSQNSGT